MNDWKQKAKETCANELAQIMAQRAMQVASLKFCVIVNTEAMDRALDSLRDDNDSRILSELLHQTKLQSHYDSHHRDIDAAIERGLGAGQIIYGIFDTKEADKIVEEANLRTRAAILKIMEDNNWEGELEYTEPNQPGEAGLWEIIPSGAELDDFMGGDSRALYLKYQEEVRQSAARNSVDHTIEDIQNHLRTHQA